MTSAAPSPIPAQEMPALLPIFPLYGNLLLPRARLPLNVFEAPYLDLVEDALGHGRMIGIIQPKTDLNAPNVPLYHVGCMGRITSFAETEDGRYLINLFGVCRFAVKGEAPAQNGYRCIIPEWTPYTNDLAYPAEDDCPYDRARLTATIQDYCKSQGMPADWNAIQGAGAEELVAMLTMICPLAPSEKQALLEAESLAARADLLNSLLDMARMRHDAPQGQGSAH